MAIFDHSVKIIARTTGRQLARVAGIDCDEWQPAESTLQATVERLADRVFLARRGAERFVVYFEFHTTWNRDALWGLLAKSALLSEREKVPTRSVVVVLRPQGFRSAKGHFQLSVENRPTQALWYEEVRWWTIKPEPWWEESPGMMALYPLCQHGQAPRDAIVHAGEIIEETAADAGERADLLTVLGIFGKLAAPHLDPLAILGREKMKESLVYQNILEEGRIDKARADVLDALRIRFKRPVPAELAAKVNTVDNEEALNRLFRLAITCKRIADFRVALVGD